MTRSISSRLLDLVDALPLKEGLRILEVGCGSGVAAREIAMRLENVFVLGLDRSEKTIRQAMKASEKEMREGKVDFRVAKIEAFELPPDQEKFDLVFAIRVGALDGRHPELEAVARERISSLLREGGRLFIDGGNPLRELQVR